jgi:inorganic pyrophosphatase
VHGDLKPANLMLVSPDGKTRDTTSNNTKLLVKIIDFGLAKALHTQADPKSLTHDRFVGTPALKAVLPKGAVFPFDFGSIPGTVAEDGDPLDVLVLMDEPAFVRCLIEARLLSVIEAEQTEDGKTERNDRLIGVAAKSYTHGSLKSLQKLDSNLIDEIEHFFVSYNDARGKKFKPKARKGPAAARRLIEKKTKKKAS